MDQFLTEIGKYRVESHIGRGAFGVVYKCVEKDTGQVVAVKTLRRVTSTTQKLLKAEIELLKSVSCVNVVRMIEHFREKMPYDPQEYDFLVMEYCESNLLDFVFTRPHHILEEREAVDIFAQILNGFRSIHEKGIIHRDLKLENVLINCGVIKIADFGLAKKLDEPASTSRHLLTRSFCGTKAYLAPEILMGSYYDYKVDIWSLGVLLFVLLFFKFPFGSCRDNPLELLKQIRESCGSSEFSVDAFISKHYCKLSHSFVKSPRKEKDEEPVVANIGTPADKIGLSSDGLDKEKMNGDELMTKMVIKQIQKINKKSNEEYIPHISNEMKDLFRRIFVIKSEERIGFEELLKHPALECQKIENIEEKIDFYGNKFPTLFRYQSEVQEKVEGQNEDDQWEEGGNKKDEITTGQMSNVMMARSMTVRLGMKQTNQIRKHIMVYNHVMCRYQMLSIAYQQVQQGWVIELLGQKDYTVLKYFLLKATLFFLQNLESSLLEGDNAFCLEEWPSFVSSRAFKSILSQVSQDGKRWLPEYHLLSQEVQEFDYDSDEIRRAVQEPIPQNCDVQVNSLPHELKLPFRGVVLTVFSKVYHYATRCFAKQLEHSNALTTIATHKLSDSLSPRQRGSLSTTSKLKLSTTKMTHEKINSQHGQVQASISPANSAKMLRFKVLTEEEFGLKAIRMALLLVSAGVINRIFEVPSCIVRLREFHPIDAPSSSQTFRFEELVEWFYQVPKEKAYKQIELILDSYFKQISSQLCPPDKPSDKPPSQSNSSSIPVSQLSTLQNSLKTKTNKPHSLSRPLKPS